MLVVATVGLVANAVAMWLLGAAQRTSINVRGAYLEVLGDLIGSAAVIVAAIVIVHERDGCPPTPSPRSSSRR